MKKIKNYLNKPHPLDYGIFSAIIPGIVVFFILFVLSPFGFRELDTLTKLYKSLGFAFITFLSVYINLILFIKLFPNIFNENNWTIKHEIIYDLLDLFFIGLWNTLLLYILKESEQNFFTLLLYIIKNTMLIGIFPTIAQISYKNSKSLKNRLEIVEELNKKFVKEIKQSTSTEFVNLITENNKPEIRLNEDQILYFKSDGNYVEVYYLKENGEVKIHLLRNRLKKVYEDLPHNKFYQCHKSFIINLSKIYKVLGNARNLSLILKDVETSIPVSRSKTEEFMNLMKN